MALRPASFLELYGSIGASGLAFEVFWVSFERSFRTIRAWGVAWRGFKDALGKLLGCFGLFLGCLGMPWGGLWGRLAGRNQNILIFASETKGPATKYTCPGWPQGGRKEAAGRVQGGCGWGARASEDSSAEKLCTWKAPWETYQKKKKEKRSYDRQGAKGKGRRQEEKKKKLM